MGPGRVDRQPRLHGQHRQTPGRVLAHCQYSQPSCCREIAARTRPDALGGRSGDRCRRARAADRGAHLRHCHHGSGARARETRLLSCPRYRPGQLRTGSQNVAGRQARLLEGGYRSGGDGQDRLGAQQRGRRRTTGQCSHDGPPPRPPARPSPGRVPTTRPPADSGPQKGPGRGPPVRGAPRPPHWGRPAHTPSGRTVEEGVFDHSAHTGVELTRSAYLRMLRADRDTYPSRAAGTLRALIRTLTEAGTPRELVESDRLGRTLKRRRADILIHYPPLPHPSGPTKATGGRLEHLRSTALGFRNQTRYRLRGPLETGGLAHHLHRKIRRTTKRPNHPFAHYPAAH